MRPLFILSFTDISGLRVDLIGREGAFSVNEYKWNSFGAPISIIRCGSWGSFLAFGTPEEIESRMEIFPCDQIHNGHAGLAVFLDEFALVKHLKDGGCKSKKGQEDA